MGLEPDNLIHSRSNWNVSWGFKSRHPGGAQFLFGDGSVHFLAEDIDCTLSGISRLPEMMASMSRRYRRRPITRTIGYETLLSI